MTQQQKKSIAMFGHKRVPSREGGVEIVVEELGTRMVQRGYRVTCYNSRGHHVSGTQFDTGCGKNHKGIRLKSVPTIEKKGLAAVTSSFLWRFTVHLVVMMWCIFMRKDRRFSVLSPNGWENVWYALFMVWIGTVKNGERALRQSLSARANTMLCAMQMRSLY